MEEDWRDPDDCKGWSDRDTEMAGCSYCRWRHDESSTSVRSGCCFDWAHFVFVMGSVGMPRKKSGLTAKEAGELYTALDNVVDTFIFLEDKNSSITGKKPTGRKAKAYKWCGDVVNKVRLVLK